MMNNSETKQKYFDRLYKYAKEKNVNIPTDKSELEQSVVDFLGYSSLSDEQRLYVINSKGDYSFFDNQKYLDEFLAFINERTGPASEKNLSPQFTALESIDEPKKEISRKEEKTPKECVTVNAKLEELVKRIDEVFTVKFLHELKEYCDLSLNKDESKEYRKIENSLNSISASLNTLRSSLNSGNLVTSKTSSYDTTDLARKIAELEKIKKQLDVTYNNYTQLNLSNSFDGFKNLINQLSSIKNEIIKICSGTTIKTRVENVRRVETVTDREALFSLKLDNIFKLSMVWIAALTVLTLIKKEYSTLCTVGLILDAVSFASYVGYVFAEEQDYNKKKYGVVYWILFSATLFACVGAFIFWIFALTII